MKGNRTTIRQLARFDADRGRLKCMVDCKGRTPKAMLGTGWAQGKSSEQVAEDLATIWEGARHGDLNQVLHAVQSGSFSVDDVSPAGWTPIMYAAKNGHAAVLRYLLSLSTSSVDKIPDKCQRTLENKGCSALHWACWHGHLECVDILCHSAQANVNARTVEGAKTPAMLVAFCGHARCFEVLHRYENIDLEARDAENMTMMIHLIRGAVRALPHDGDYVRIFHILQQALPLNHALWTSEYTRRSGEQLDAVEVSHLELKSGERINPLEELRLQIYRRHEQGLPSKGKITRMIEAHLKRVEKIRCEDERRKAADEVLRKEEEERKRKENESQMNVGGVLK